MQKTAYELRISDWSSDVCSSDLQAVGLGDLGKPDHWHERQVSHWRQQLDGYRRIPEYDGSLPHVDGVGRWLTDELPDNRRIGIVHGDLQFPNVMFSLQAPRISGVVDWELRSEEHTSELQSLMRISYAVF